MVLPETVAGTRHFTDDPDSYVIEVKTKLESAKIIRHNVVDLLKFGKEVVKVTFTASNRADVGITMTLGTGKGGGGGAVVAGGADVVTGGEG